VAIYLLVSQLFMPKLYNFWIALVLHIWMVIFWLAQFSAVARLAALWGGTSCGGFYYSSYCWYYYKRDLVDLAKRDTTTYGAYFGALVAGSVLGAFEFVLWVVSMIVLGIHIQRHQNAARNSAPPPMYTGATMGDQAAVPMEKYGAQATPQPQYAQPVQQQNYSPQQPQPPQPAYNQAQGPQFTTPYTQQPDPVNRGASISPVTVAGQPYPSPNTVELASPQHTGNYNPNAAELNTTPSHPTNAAELGNDQQRYN
jgi:hypothetical protein